MIIDGSCYCERVSFSAVSNTPYPFMRCYCSFCRKTSGSGGYGINIMAQADSLIVQGQKSLVFHHGIQHDPVTDRLMPSEVKRFFCRQCGSPLWAADPRWPEWIYPYASVVKHHYPGRQRLSTSCSNSPCPG